MKIFDAIKEDFKEARVAGNKLASGLLSTVVGEIENKAKMVDGMKQVAEESVVSTLKTFIKNVDTFKDNVTDTVTHAKLMAEKQILEKYLPSQLSEDELRDIFASIDHSNMGIMMKHLKDNYSGRYDGSVASKVAKEFL